MVKPPPPCPPCPPGHVHVHAHRILFLEKYIYHIQIVRLPTFSSHNLVFQYYNVFLLMDGYSICFAT